MLKDDRRMYYYYVFTFAMLLSAITCSCNGQWSVGGYQLTDSDSTIFHHIKDHQDEVHWYRNIIEGENWCYKHEEYENVEVK
tara:strand:- start:333 stop:578 length:246 start_codon:yes stop_codon:yes gene_type:complete